MRRTYRRGRRLRRVRRYYAASWPTNQEETVGQHPMFPLTNWANTKLSPPRRLASKEKQDTKGLCGRKSNACASLPMRQKPKGLSPHQDKCGTKRSGVQPFAPDHYLGRYAIFDRAVTLKELYQAQPLAASRSRTSDMRSWTRLETVLQ